MAHSGEPRETPSSSPSRRGATRAGRGRSAPAEHGQGGSNRNGADLQGPWLRCKCCVVGVGTGVGPLGRCEAPLAAKFPMPPWRSRCGRMLRARERSQRWPRPEQNLLGVHAKEGVEAGSSCTEGNGGAQLAGHGSVRRCLAAVVGPWDKKRTWCLETSQHPTKQAIMRSLGLSCQDMYVVSRPSH